MEIRVGISRLTRKRFRIESDHKLSVLLFACTSARVSGVLLYNSCFYDDAFLHAVGSLSGLKLSKVFLDCGCMLRTHAPKFIRYMAALVSHAGVLVLAP